MAAMRRGIGMGTCGLLAVLLAVAVAPAAGKIRAAEIEYRPCNPQEPALAMVTDLSHVTMKTACRLTVAVQKVGAPTNAGNRISKFCWNPFLHIHRFRGWRLDVRDNGISTMRRGRSYFKFAYQDGPLSCV
jgi:hypothetical protein